MKLFFLILCVSVSIGSVGCTDKQSETDDNSQVEHIEKSGSGESNRPIKILSEITGGKDPEEHQLWMAEATRLSGLKIQMTKASGTEYPTKLTTALAAGEDYDLVYMLSGEFEKLHKLDLFEPLSQRIKNSRILGNPAYIDQSEWDRIRRDDGEIYGVFSAERSGRLPLVRNDWMKRLGLKDPSTLEDYYEVFKAFTFGDPDQNGEADTYGLTIKNIYDIQPFMGANGVYAGYAKDEDGNWYIPYATEEAEMIYDWLHRLYDEGLMDPNFITNSSSNCREMILSNRAGMMVYWSGWIMLFDDKVKARNPLTSFEMRGLAPPLDKNKQGVLTRGQDGLWVMLSKSKNKDKAFEWLEFYHSDKGSLINSLGIKDYDYTMEAGVYTLTETGKDHAMDHGTLLPKSLHWTNPIKSIENEKNYISATNILKTYGREEILRDTSRAANEIVRKYAVKAIIGEITSREAVKSMQVELKVKGYID